MAAVWGRTKCSRWRSPFLPTMGLWLARRAEPSTSQPIWETVGFTAPRVDRPEWQKFLAALPRCFGGDVGFLQAPFLAG